MSEVIASFANEISKAYVVLTNSLPPQVANFLNIVLMVFLVFIYSVGIWKFYRFIARKNILELNLNKYSNYQHPFFVKLLAIFFYFIEYLIFLPILVLIWFSGFTIFLILLADNQTVASLIVISTIVIAAIRMTAYYSEDLSKDLAKMLPFTLLGLAITKPNFFNIERVIGQLSDIPTFFSHILFYFVFIIILEIFLRLLEFIFSLLGLEEAQD